MGLEVASMLLSLLCVRADELFVRKMKSKKLLLECIE